MRFFFYGTLIDPDVRRLVLGRRAPAAVEPAILAGWRRVPVAGASYPAIARHPGRSVDGVLARGFGPAAQRLLVAYEGDEYDLVDVEVTAANGRRIAAKAFVARAGVVRRGRGTWDYAGWARRHKRRFLAALVLRGTPS